MRAYGLPRDRRVQRGGCPACREGLAAPGTANQGLSRSSQFGASGPCWAAQAPGLGAAGRSHTASSAWNLIRASLVSMTSLLNHSPRERGHGWLSPAGTHGNYPPSSPGRNHWADSIQCNHCLLNTRTVKHRGYQQGLWSQEDWVWILTLLFGQSLSLSEPWFSHLQNRVNNSTYFIGLYEPKMS